MNLVEISIIAGMLAAQAPYRGPPVVYVPPGYPQVAPPPVYRAPPPVQQPRALSRDEERERIIDAGEAFCRRWATDRVCHPKAE